ncbi:hypothetical protein Mapa_002138 [Marchantia paleacea]|nr:hypothetical protein Mapa_002138 [Marchantia paleacea]
MELTETQAKKQEDRTVSSVCVENYTLDCRIKAYIQIRFSSKASSACISHRWCQTVLVFWPFRSRFIWLSHHNNLST